MTGTVADAIRQFVNATYIEPARTAGTAQVAVRAGDVHKAMNLKDRMPAVASTLGAKTFETKYRVQCLARTGPHNGARLEFTFKILP
jgi:5-methylcytosine-specific restriction enzyme B